MMTPLSNLFYRILPAAAVIGLLAACVPPPTATTVNGLTPDMRSMQSSLDRHEQAILDLSKQVAELEKRLQQQSPGTSQTRTLPPGQAQTSPGTAMAALQTEGSPTEIYLQAFGDYASGRYQAAIHGFGAFLQRFPNNSYASNAQFWLGDCYFNQQQYPLAIQEFKRVLNDYQNAPKSPDALLKIAIAQLQLGATGEAREAIDTLGRRYPKSIAAQKAQELNIP